MLGSAAVGPGIFYQRCQVSVYLYEFLEVWNNPKADFEQRAQWSYFWEAILDIT